MIKVHRKKLLRFLHYCLVPYNVNLEVHEIARHLHIHDTTYQIKTFLGKVCDKICVNVILPCRSLTLHHNNGNAESASLDMRNRRNCLWALPLIVDKTLAHEHLEWVCQFQANALVLPCRCFGWCTKKSSPSFWRAVDVVEIIYFDTRQRFFVAPHESSLSFAKKDGHKFSSTLLHSHFHFDMLVFATISSWSIWLSACPVSSNTCTIRCQPHVAFGVVSIFLSVSGEHKITHSFQYDGNGKHSVSFVRWP